MAFTSVERRALAATVAGGSLVPLNSTMIAVALPDIGDGLGVSPGRGALLVTTYLVVMLVAQPLGGRVGDRAGHRRVAAAGLVLFALASIAAAAAPSFWALLTARCLQAVAGAGFSPSASALLRHIIAADRRGKAFGIMGSGIGTGAAIGPVLGGLLVAVGDWRLLFLANVPVIGVALVLVSRLPTTAHVPADAPTTIVTTLRSRPFAAACLTQAAGNFTLYGALLVLPLVLAAKGWTSGPTGLAVSVLTVGMLVLSPIGGRAGDGFGRSRVVVAGMTVAVAGAAVFAASLPSAPPLIVGALLLGCGQGLAGASLHAAAVEAAPIDAAGSAAGLFSTSRYVGSIASSVLVAALAVDDAASARPVAVAIVLTALVAVVAGTRITPDRGRPPGPPSPPVPSPAAPASP